MPALRVYIEEFKREAVRLAKESGNLCATARNLGLCQTVLQRRKNALEQETPNPFPGHGNPSDPELARLKRENARLQEEVEILKKAVGIFTSRPHYTHFATRAEARVALFEYIEVWHSGLPPKEAETIER